MAYHQAIPCYGYPLLDLSAWYQMLAVELLFNVYDSAVSYMPISVYCSCSRRITLFTLAQVFYSFLFQKPASTTLIWKALDQTGPRLLSVISQIPTNYMTHRTASTSIRPERLSTLNIRVNASSSLYARLKVILVGMVIGPFLAGMTPSSMATGALYSGLNQPI